MIDMVYTWVDGDDLNHQRLAQTYSKVKRDLIPERTRDIYQMMRYSLRSVEMYAPWINKIYIVTMRPQKPAWLNTNHPNIQIVHHDEVFEDHTYLPTFNSNVIESYLHRIPNLAEKFIYMNDDFLFGSRILESDFVESGRLKIYGTVMGEKIPFVFENIWNDLVSKLQHTPLIISKSFYQEMFDVWAKQAHETRLRKFRTRKDLMPHGLYRYYFLSKKAEYVQAVPMWEYLKFYTFHKIMNDLPSQERAFQKIRQKRPKFLCLNDDQGDDPNGAVVRLVKSFLNEWYPNPSEYEVSA
ncbi:MAG: Stealth CR1 domain-containing protein [Chloroflexota bacterium]